MANNYEEGLKGTAEEAVASQKLIAKYFASYGSSGLPDASKHQLIYATRVMHTIAKCDLKHSRIYCDIITQTFGDQLRPQAGAKYWDSYVDSLRFFHYTLAAKKEHKLASLLYNHISLYNNNLENETVCFKLVNIYSYHFILQNSLMSSDRRTAERECYNVLDNLTYLFQEMLEKHKQLNFQYPDIFKKSVQCLLPRSGQSSSIRFFNTLPEDKVLAMFESLFKLTTQQRIPKPTEEAAQLYGLNIMETLYTLLQFDINNKFRLQLSVQLLNYCRVDRLILADKTMSEFYSLFYEYLKLLTLQARIADFPKHFIKRCQRFKELFELHSKRVMTQSWFQDFLVVFTYMHSQLQNSTVFECFWGQMTDVHCFKTLLDVLLESMKLAPCISSDTTLNWISCCSSFRKHNILTCAQTALSTFVLYCQNVRVENEPTDTSTDDIHKTLILIVNHAFKIIEKMDCITSTSQDINHLITRFKQAAINAKNENQANTCIALCELFLKIKSKMPEKEWPLILRRLYKVVEQCMAANKWPLQRELQMCYVASMLQLSTELDFNQIRAQITIYYSQALNADGQQENITSSDMVHNKCLLHAYQHSKNVLRPHLNVMRKKLLLWMEVQHIAKYYRTNAALMQSLMQCCQTQYDFVMLARLENGQTPQVLAKLVAIQKSLKSKVEESQTSLTRLEQLTYGHTCVAILQDQKNLLIQKATKMESKDFAETQLHQLLARKEMEAITVRKELVYVKLAYVAYKAFEIFYERSDHEHISSDDAIIDWEAIMEDLVILAQFFQLGGYIEYSCHVWLLLYKISQFVQDQFSAFRALIFICEYSEFYENTADLRLQVDKEIQLHLPHLTEALEKFNTMSKRKENYVLLAITQIAYYYARCSKYAFAQMLLKYVEQKHNELPERQGKYDVVMCTLDIVRYRLLWKHMNEDGDRKKNCVGQGKRLNQSLMYSVEQTLDRFKHFVCFTSSDNLAYIILLCNLLQDITECSANRLYDNFMSNLFPAVCKCIISHGLALRMVQLMSSWMWINLQMEFVDEAHIKLRIIEFVMGVASLKELSTYNMDTAAKNCISPSLAGGPFPIDTLSLANNNGGIEAMRRLTQAQLSPIKTGKLQLSSQARKHKLTSYLTYKIEMTSIASNELFEWFYFIIACFNARLNFLIEDFDQLEEFYDKGRVWLERRQNEFHKRFFKNFPLVAMQHYANFLRACRKNDKANQCLTYALAQFNTMQHGIDPVYRVNLKLQQLSMNEPLKNILKHNNKSQRLLRYNVAPQECKHKHEQAKRAIKDQMLKQAGSSTKKEPAALSNSGSKSNSSSATSARKCKNSSNSSTDNNLVPKSKITKTKLKINICEDSIEILDLSPTNDKCARAKLEPASGTLKKDRQQRSTKKSEKPTRTTSKSVENGKLPIAAIDLLDSSETSSSSSSLDCKENQHVDNDELVKQLESLNIAENKKTATRSRLKKTTSLQKPASATVIVSDDSPTLKSLTKVTHSRVRSNKSPDIVKDSTLKAVENEHSSNVEKPANGLRRQRRIIAENGAKETNTVTSTATALSSGIAASSMSTRRRQKI